MLLGPIFGLVLKFFILSDRPGYKHATNHFLSLYNNIFEKTMGVFGSFSGNSKIAFPMDYKPIVMLRPKTLGEHEIFYSYC